MDFKHLTVDEPSAGVVRCVMANPPTHTLVAGEVEELETFANDLDRRDDVRVVVFTGGGEGVFIRHYEVGELAASAARNQAQAEQSADDRAAMLRNRPIGSRVPQTAEPGLHRFNRLALQLQDAQFVTVAAINGNAAGGGLEFALGCDFRLMADGDFRIGLPETGVGIIPGAGGTQRFARLLGVAKALDLVLRGTMLAPREALALGLLHAVYPPLEFADRALAFAVELAARSPIALAAAKRAIYQGVETDLRSGLAIEQAQFARCMASGDAAGALRAAMDGRRWRWRGR